MKLPALITDLVSDLRDRGLLPVAIGLLVAIVAVPVLLGKGAEQPPASVDPSAALAGPGGPAGPAPVVLANAAEIRAYRERLKAYNEKDPFRPDVTDEKQAGSGKDAVADAPEGSAGVSVSGEVTPPEIAEPADKDGGSSGEAAPAPNFPLTPPVDDPAPVEPAPVDPEPKPEPEPAEAKILIPVVDIEAGRAGKARSQKGVTVGEYQPGPVDPFAQFFEASFRAGEATFLITPTARAVKGDGKCRPKRARCRALTLEEGETAYVIDSTDGARYKLELIDVRLVEIDPRDLEILDVVPGFKDPVPQSADLEPVVAG